MLDLKQLDDFITPYDLRFELGGHEYEYQYPMQAVLNLRRVIAKGFKEASEDFPSEADWVFTHTAPLVGAKYNAKTGDVKGGLFDDVRANTEIGFSFVNRLLYSIFMQFFSSVSAAETFAQTGDMGKALGLDKLQAQVEKAREAVAQSTNSDAPANQETDQAPTETGGEDSDEIPTA